MAVQTWILHAGHTFLSFLISICSYWTTLASNLQFTNVTKELDWLPAGYYTVPTADELNFSGMKTPLHLGLLMLEDTYCLASIALIISLAYSIGVRHISLYATNGFSDPDIIALHREIAARMTLRDVNVRMRSISDAAPLHTGKSDLNIHMVQPNEGKAMLLDITKLIARKMVAGELSRSDVTPEYIDRILKGLTKCPDPDMILNFGSAPSTCGYLPWQLRLTEIISVPKLKNFTAKSFKRALMSFSKIEQRFGK